MKMPRQLRRVSSVRLVGLCVGVAVFFAAAAGGAEFRGVGFLEPSSQSIAFGISANGQVVVGESISPQGFEAFRWTRAGGMVGLGWLDPNIPSSQAFATNADGSVIVGVSQHPHALLEDGAPVFWAQGGAAQLIHNLGGSDTGGTANGVTPDGRLIVGFCHSSNDIYEPFRWTAAGGTQGLGLLANEQLGRALAASADGSIIVGNVSSGSIAFPRAFRWTVQTGMVLLPTLNPGALSSANAITPDGRMIVGQSGGRAALWDENQNVSSLGEFPNGFPGSIYTASAVTANGHTVVGLGEYNAGQGLGEAFIWDAATGMRRLGLVLTTEFGVNLGGWGLFDATGISADGAVIAGYGFDPQGFQEGWVVRLRFARGDLNCDGVVNFDDINPFVLALSDPAGYHAAFPDCDIMNGDINGDGRVDFEDINPFVALLAGA